MINVLQKDLRPTILGHYLLSETDTPKGVGWQSIYTAQTSQNMIMFEAVLNSGHASVLES
jgi:hypothetical protein